MKVIKTIADIKKRLAANPETNHLIIYIAAGHGMNVDGQQVLLVNQFDKNERFYKWFAIEKEIRMIAKHFPHNTYQLGIFACCREIYKESYHKGRKKGSNPNAVSEALAAEKAITE